jgi:hypothetical protein
MPQKAACENQNFMDEDGQGSVIGKMMAGGGKRLRQKPPARF